MPNYSRTPRRAEAAVALRLAGSSYDEIAEALQYQNALQAIAAVEKVLAASVTAEDRDRMREVASRRYERLLRAVWPKAIDPASPEQLAAIRTARELVDRHVVLQGLAMPQEVVVRTPTTQELEQWVARVTQLAMPKVIEYDVLGEPPAIEGNAEAS